MRNSKFRVARYATILTTLVALTGLAASTQAASFRKSWDPEFSDVFSGLVGVDVGWRGEALISVSDPCVAPGTVIFPDPCGAASLQSYELEFYDVGTDAILGTGSDTAPGTPPFPDVTAVSFDGSSLADGVSLAGPLSVPGTFTFGDYPFSFNALLSFDLAGPSLTLVENCGDLEFCSSYQNDGATYPPTVTWERVPVPASIALVGIGLVALGLMRRRTA